MEKRKTEKENIEVLKRYCEDRYTIEDINTIHYWSTEPGNDLIRRVALKSVWSEFAGRDYAKSKTSYEADSMLGRIHRQINRQEVQKSGKGEGFQRKQNLLQIFTRIAAVLFLPLLITSLLYLNQKASLFSSDSDLQYAELHAPAFARVNLYLADSTRVWLNNGSKLKYPMDFSGRDRKVFLEGEAYFDVRKDPSHPFYVETGDIKIHVTGTRFNVSNYIEDEDIITTLEEGKVLVRLTGQGRKSPVIHELLPSRQLIFMKENRDVKLRTVNTEKYTSWKEGHLYLKDDPMPEVRKKIERWYNVEIVIEDPVIMEYRYTGRFHQETLEKVLRMMAVATPIKYTIKKGSRQPDNSFSKDTVFITKK